MAMTDYTSKLVHTGYCNGDTSKPIKLYVAYKSSQSVANNKSTVSCGMYVTTPPEAGWDIGPWTDFNGSYVGTKSNTFDGDIPNFEGTYWIAENLKFTVSHNNAGEATATIYWKWGVNSPWGKTQNPSGSFSVKLPTIARASSVSASKGTLGTEQTLTVNRKSSSFTHTIAYSCGSASGTICSKSSSTSVAWTPPLSLAKQNTTGSSVSIKLTITTYNGSTKVGSAKTTTFTASIPSSVKPTASLSLSDPTGHKTTYGGYIQGASKLEVSLSGTGAQDSTIKSYKITIGDSTYNASSKTVSLPNAGSIKVTGTVTDSRSRSGSASETISVLAYTDPKVTKITAQRCNSDGTANDEGAYINVTFSASITALSNKNTAAYTVEYKKDGASSWTSVAASGASGNYSPSNVSVVFAADTESAYYVRVKAQDAFGSVTSPQRTVSVAFVLMQSDVTGTGLGIGQKATKPKTVQIGLPVEMAQPLRHNGYDYFESDWIDLGLSSGLTPPVEGSDHGRYPAGCGYRTVGRHVYVAFNCCFTFNGDYTVVSGTQIPAALRPAHNVYAMCASGGRYVARVLVSTAGNVGIDWVQDITSGASTTTRTVSWIDGYIDYWI